MEFLKEYLGDELYIQVEQAVEGKGLKLANLANGDYVAKEKFIQSSTQVKELQEQIKERDGQLEELKKQAGNSEELNKRIAELEQKNQQFKADWEQRDVDDAVKEALRENKAKDAAIVMPQIDCTKLIIQDGKVVGLDEQIKALQEKHAYLFDIEEPGTGGGGNPGNHIPPIAKDNPWAKETRNIHKQTELFRKDPAEARRLAALAGVKL